MTALDLGTVFADRGNMSEQKKFGADKTVDVIKLLITLSVGFLGFSAALLKFTFDANTSFEIQGPYWFLIGSWTLILLVISSGVLALGSIITNAVDHDEFNVDTKWVQIPQMVQQVSFVASFVTYIIFIILS